MTQTPPVPSHLGDILVVDDTTANLQLLTGMLKGRGYKVRPAPNGETALRAASASPPELVLLDITMPGMDGYEVCRRLKADPKLREIPVLFISALDESEDKLRAFEVGGVDYVRKPFQLDEVDARVRTHLALRRQQTALKETNARLEELERLRDNLTHMIAHDMKSPLLALRLSLDALRPTLTANDADAQETFEVASDCVGTLVEMITQMLDVSRLEAGQMPLTCTCHDLSLLARELHHAHRRAAGERNFALLADSNVEVNVDVPLIRRVIANLLGNAIKFTDPERGAITLSVRTEGASARLEVKDDGPGIARQDQARIFEKFAQVQGKKARLGSGLGLAFAKMAVEAHAGQIGVVSDVGAGSAFWISLPRVEAKLPADTLPAPASTLPPR